TSYLDLFDSIVASKGAPGFENCATEPPSIRKLQTAKTSAYVPDPPPQAQGNRICVNKTGISLFLDSVCSNNDSSLFTHMRLPCPQAGEGNASVCIRQSGSAAL